MQLGKHLISTSSCVMGCCMPKVALLSSGLGHVSRGVETWTEDLGNALVTGGVSVTVFKGGGKRRVKHERVTPCLWRSGKFSQWIMRHRPGFLWRFGFANGYTLEEMTFCWALLPSLLIWQFNIIHTQDPDVALFCHWLYKIKLIRSKVIFAHGTEETFQFLNKFDYVQHLAPFHLDEAKANSVNNKQAFAIGNFVNTDVFIPQKSVSLRKEFNIPCDAFVILSVAAIKTHHKRIDYLINEVARLNNKNVYLVVAGSKVAETDAVIKMGKQALGERGIFLTDVSRDRIPELYGIADVFALCSLKEMMPIALLEALSSGLPCLVHTYPVEQWMIADGGESLDMSCAGNLANVVGKYFDESYRHVKSQKARVQAVNIFSKDVILEKVLTMYKEVLCQN